MSEKHNEVIEVPGIRAEDHEDLIAGARVASAGEVNSFIDRVMEEAEFFRSQREGKVVDKAP